MKKLIAFILLLSPLILFSTPLDIKKETTDLSKKEIIKQLQKGGNIIYLRHSATNKKEKDKTKNLTNCSLQRNLSKKGIELAKNMGMALNKLNVPITQVYSSPYCRCKDTAKLALGTYKIDNGLRFSITSDKDETLELKKHLQNIFLNSYPKKGENIFIVAHTSNLKEAVNIWPKQEGLMVVFKKKDDQLYLLKKIKPEFWENF